MSWDARKFWKALEEMGGHYLKRIFLKGHIVKLNFGTFL